MTNNQYSVDNILQLLEERGIHFENSDYVAEAFTHSTFSNEQNLSYNNERLEFLGDSVLNLTVSEILYSKFPQYSEAQLSKIKSYLISNQILANVCHDLGFNNYLYMGNGEIKQKGNLKKRNLACLFEAVLGAIYLDQGLDLCREVVLNFVVEKYMENSENSEFGNYKGTLQELSMKLFSKTPRYKMLDKNGEEHRPFFTVQVSINKILYGYGYGASLKKAQNEAAYFALQKIKKEQIVNSTHGR